MEWTEEATTALLTGCRELGMDLSSDSIRRLILYGERIIQANAEFNLTSIVDPVDIALKHFVDSLCLVRAVSLMSAVLIVDLGCGAGLPGIPLAIAFPQLHVKLIDSTLKKVRFVERVCEELQLTNTTCIWGRCDGKSVAGLAGDIVIARALGHLSMVLELGLPLTRIGGKVVAYKGKEDPVEIASAREACRLLGGVLLAVEKYKVPVIGDRRTLVIFGKVSQTPSGFPRSGNLPKLHPLGS